MINDPYSFFVGLIIGMGINNFLWMYSLRNHKLIKQSKVDKEALPK